MAGRLTKGWVRFSSIKSDARSSYSCLRTASIVRKKWLFWSDIVIQTSALSMRENLLMIGSFHQRRLVRSRCIWILMFLGVGVGSAFESYFVRELVSALLLFTVAFVIAAAFVTLFILMEEVLERGVVMTASIANLIGTSIHEVREEYGASSISHTNSGTQRKRLCRFAGFDS